MKLRSSCLVLLRVATMWLGLAAMSLGSALADDGTMAKPPVDWTPGSAWRSYLADSNTGAVETTTTALQYRGQTGLTAGTTVGRGEGGAYAETIARALSVSDDHKQNALRILNWMHHSVEYLPYYGLIKGAETTAQDLEGNDYDQCALLVTLLKYSGIPGSAIQYKEGDVDYTPEQIAAWLHWESEYSVAAFKRFGIPVVDNGTAIRLRRVWVELTLDGSTYRLDPAYRETTRDPLRTIESIDAGYSSAAITNAANATAPDNDEVSIDATGVVGLQAVLSARSNALSQAATQNESGLDPVALLGLTRPVGAALSSLPMAIVGVSSVVDSWTTIPEDRAKKIGLAMRRRDFQGTIYEPAVTVSRYTYEMGEYGWDMRAFGVTMMLCRTNHWGGEAYTPEMPRKLGDWYIYFEVSESFPETQTTKLVYKDKAVPFSNRDGISVRIGTTWTHGTSRGKLKRQLARHADVLAKYGNDSDEAHASARYVLSLQRAVMSDNARMVGSAIGNALAFDSGSIWFTRESVGSGKWAVDGPLDRTAIAKVRANGASLPQVQWSIGVMNSAAEHATMELAGSPAAASTISAIESAFRAGKKLVRLRNEALSTTVEKAGGSGNLATGVEDYLKERGGAARAFVPNARDITIYGSTSLKSSCALFTGSISSSGPDPEYWALTGAMIEGKFQGGMSPDMYLAPTVIATNASAAPQEKPATAAPTVTGADPVNLNSGAFLYSVDGLTVGSGMAPRGLNYQHFYSSGKVGADRVGLGRGWTHSYDMAVSRRNYTDLDPRTAAVCELAPYLVGMRYLCDLGTSDPTAKEVGLKAIAAGWLARQLRDAQVIVTLGADELRFFRTQTNAYFCTSGVPATLTGSNTTGYQLQFRHGNTINFRASDGRAVSVVDPYSKSLTLEYYPGTQKLLRVTDCWNRQIEFFYNGAALTVVSSLNDADDGSNRSFNYARNVDVSSNEANFTITDPESATTVFHEDSARRVDRVTDARNRVVIVNSYDAFNRVEAQLPLDDTSRLTTIGYAPGLTRETDAFSNDSWHYFDRRGRREQFVDANGASWQWQYDGVDRTVVAASPRGLSDTNGGVWQFGFNANHELVSVTNPKGHSRAIEINDTTKQVLVHNYEGKVTTVDLTAQYAVKKITTPGGLVSEFEYNTDGQLVKFRGPAQQTLDATIGTKFTNFDTWGNPRTITYPNGATSQITYGKRGQATVAIGRRGEKATFEYNRRGQSTRVYRWYNQADPTSLTYDAKVCVQVAYDLVGDVDYVVNGAAVQTDANGTPITAGRKVDFDYNALGDLVSVEQVLSDNSNVRVLTNTYDERNNLWKSTDALNHTVENSYDAIGRPRWVKDQLGRLSRFYFDDDGNLTDSVSPAFRSVSGDTDLRGFLEASQDPIGYAIKYGYDKDGRMTSLKNRRGNTYTWSYDDVARTVSATTPLNFTESVQINTRGLVESTTKPSGTKFKATSWDNEGRVLSECDEKPDHTQTFVRSYVYEANGLLSQATETNSDGTFTSTRSYDQLNRLREYSDGEGNTIGYSYYPDGRLKKLRYPGGTKEVTYAYDDFGRLSTVTDWNNSTTTYTYDAASRLTGTLRPNGTTRTQSYYDDNQLKQVVEKLQNQTPIWFVRLQRDADGLVNERVVMTPSTASTVPSDDMTFDADNRISTFNGSAVTHDSDGNMTNGPLPSGAFASYTYDTRDRLVSAGGLSYRYGVDGFRTDVNGLGSNSHSVWDPNSGLGNLLVKEVGTSKTYYVYGQGLLYELAGNATTPSHTYHYDELGSTIALTDSSGSHVGDTFAYSSYGSVVSYAGPAQTEFLFHGSWGVASDPNGLTYMRNRYYNNRVIRFLSADPIRFQAGSNWYGFVGGDPIGFIDPFGLCRSRSTGGLEDGWSVLEFGMGVGDAYAGAQSQTPINPFYIYLQAADVWTIATADRPAYEYWKRLAAPYFFIKSIPEKLETARGQGQVTGTAVLVLVTWRAGAQGPRIPMGFAGIEEFAAFVSKLKDGLRGQGGGIKAIFQGSSVTGKSYRTGKPFDVGRVSDFDIALTGGNLLARARALGVQLRGRGTRTGPLSAADLQKLGLSELAAQLSKEAGRPVNFMIYDSVETAVSRAPSIPAE